MHKIGTKFQDPEFDQLVAKKCVSGCDGCVAENPTKPACFRLNETHGSCYGIIYAKDTKAESPKASKPKTTLAAEVVAWWESGAPMNQMPKFVERAKRETGII